MATIMADATPATPRIGWLHGLSWRGALLLLAVCAVNALRRNINSRLLRDDPLDWLEDLGHLTVSGFILGAIVVTVVVIAVNRGPTRRRARYALALVAAAASSLIGTVLLLGYDTGWTWIPDPDPRNPPGEWGVWGSLARTWPRYALYSALFAVVYLYLRDRHEREAALRDLDAERARFEQRTLEARLQRLQAQIEPHFLFNTLAHVRRLYETDPRAGRGMLDNLIAYLEEALPQMREARSTVTRETALTQAYLAMQQVRMGPRLAYAFDVAPDAAAASLPPMMLLTLVENSIKHGLSPLPEGGSVAVRVTRERGALVVVVADTGRGFTNDAGTGTGLANIRARLAALYGPEASLQLARNVPHGVIAHLVVPLDGSPGIEGNA